MWNHWRRKRKAGALLLTLAFFLTATGEVGGEEGDLEVTLVLDASRYVLGQPIFFTITLTNTGARAVRAHISSHELDSFDLEMATAEGSYEQLNYHAVEVIRGRPSMRDFGPGERVGTSGALLFKAPQITRFTAEELEKAFLNRQLVCDRPGTYKLRAKVYIDFGETQQSLDSGEVTFEVTPATEEYGQFLNFAKRHVCEVTLDHTGYEAAKALVERFKGTAYCNSLKWMMMEYYLKNKMGEDRPRPEVPEPEKKERQEYRALAEQIIGLKTQRRTRLGEMALTYLAVYYVQAQDLEKALSYAEILRTELPWSSRRGAAESIRRSLEKQKDY